MKNYTITVNGNVYDVSGRKRRGRCSGFETGSEKAAPAPKAAPAQWQKQRAQAHSGESRRGRKSIPDPDKRRSECSTG